MARAAEHEDGRLGREVGTLYVVSTPIGNLEDVTLRAIDVLKRVDTVAAEDTRVTAKLLAHYGIGAKKLVALHEHNEARAAPGIISELENGRSVALASDAGTPAFSDPGARLVEAVRSAGLRVVPVPGATAAAAALSASGFIGPQFLFYGFLPAKPAERRKALERIAAVPWMLVLYEAPHRILETVADLAAILGASRRVVIARELTKMFETIHVCELGAAQGWLAEDPNRTRGEFVLIVGGAQEDRDETLARGTHALEILLEELPVKQAAGLASRITGARRNALYEIALGMKGRRL
jgi:16S rRNA (cytidine1402-2'-O)-methyltransferase